jgi:hypothetical protein
MIVLFINLDYPTSTLKQILCSMQDKLLNLVITISIIDMKSIICGITLVFILVHQSFCQGCLPEGVIFSRQSQIDSFQILFPDCRCIQGDVTIHGTDITDLEPLSMLDSIRGDLYIHDNSPELDTLDMHNMKLVGGDLRLYNNHIKNFFGFGCLSTINGNLRIIHEPDLTGFEGLNSLDTIFGDFLLSNCDSINILNGLDELSFIQGYCYITGCSRLTVINGLNNLAHVGGLLKISNNNILNGISGFSSLQSSHGIQILSNNHMILFNGMHKVTNVIGNIEFIGNPELESLQGLDSLSVIKGDLRISGNLHLLNVFGMNQLSLVKGEIEISSNTMLYEMSGLSNLSSDSVSKLAIYKNYALQTCNYPFVCNYLADPSGKVNVYMNAPGCNNPPEIAATCGISLACLPFGDYHFCNQYEIDHFPSDYMNCNYLAGNVTIGGNDITNLDSLSGIGSVEGNLYIGSTEFGENQVLYSVHGLENLESVGGELWIKYNYILDSLEGLENVLNTGGLCVEYNLKLEDLYGLNHLDTIRGKLDIFNNYQLKNLHGLNNLKKIAGDAFIRNNPELESFTGIENLSYVGGNLTLRSNAGITDCSGLNGLTKVNRNLLLEDNSSLLNLQGFDSLKYIGSNLYIENCDLLNSLQGIQNLVAIGGALYILENDSLQTIYSLGMVDTLQGIRIFENYNLASLDGLENLTTITGYFNNFSIEYNHSLASVSALHNLTYIGRCDVLIHVNPSLTSLSGFDNIDMDSVPFLEITNNALLSTCDVKSICDYLSSSNSNSSIYENAPGCNSWSEVMNQCWLGVNEDYTDIINPYVFPNPVTGTIRIDLPEIQSGYRIVLYSLEGRCLKDEAHSGNRPYIDLSGIPAGIYLLKITGGNRPYECRIVKI